MTRFKICGLRDSGNALVAARSGAEFLGFVFVPGVRRQLQEEHARDIIRGYRRLHGEGGPRLVGLFADQPLDDVNRILRHCGLDLAQLCGDEPPEYWDAVDAPVIKQIKVNDSAPRDEVILAMRHRVAEVAARGHIPLLDKHRPGFLGGTASSFDWTIAGDVGAGHEIVLAGGLTPQNVSGAIATARPWGVDVSSGVESDGDKDPEKIAAFASAVRRADGHPRTRNA